MNTRKEKLEAFGRILDIMDELRVKCPWDREQTSESLRPQTIEEVYELSDAILKNDSKNISKELGDVLLHVIFYSKIGEEKGQFDIADVINLLCDKLIYRHPHVFSSVQVENSAQVMQNWEMLKAREKDGNRRILSGVPDALPPLLKAYRMQDKARSGKSSGSTRPSWTAWRRPPRSRKGRRRMTGPKASWGTTFSRWSTRRVSTGSIRIPRWSAPAPNSKGVSPILKSIPYARAAISTI